MKNDSLQPYGLHIKQNTGKYLFEPGSILRVQARNNYCKIYFIDQQRGLVVSKVLRWVQCRLPEEMFVRVHRSHLVNRMHVQQVQASGTKTIQVTNEDCVPVSRRKRAMV